MLPTCPGLHSTAGRPGFEPATCWSQVQRPNHSATEPHKDQEQKQSVLCFIVITKKEEIFFTRIPPGWLYVGLNCLQIPDR